MAVKLFELGFLLSVKGLTAAVEQLNRFGNSMKRVEEASNKMQGLRDTAMSVGKVGLAMGAAGAAIGLPLENALEKTDKLEDHMNRLMVASGKFNDEASRAKAMSFVTDESMKLGYSADQLTESLYQGVSGFLTFDQAMAVSTTAAKLARVTQGDLASTTGLLTTMMLNFGDATKTSLQNAQMLSDELAALQTQFKFTDLGDLTAAMRIAAPSALGFGVARQQAEGILAALSAGGDVGETGGEALREILAQSSKASEKLGFQIFPGANGKGMDLLKTLDGIKAKFGDISQNVNTSAMFEEAFGRQAFSALSIVLKNLDKAHDAVTGLATSTGVVDRAMGVFGEHGSMTWDRLHASMDAIEILIGGMLLPHVDKLAHLLVDRVAPAMMSFAHHHPLLTKIGVTMAAIVASTLLLGGALAIASAGIMGFVSFGPAMVAFANAIGIVSLATKAWAAAQWLLNAAMDANPIGLLIIGAAVLAAAAYGVYEYWDALKAFFKDWGLTVLGFLIAPWAMIPYEIYKHMDAIKKAASLLSQNNDY